MLAKTESARDVEEVARRTEADVIALVETPLGVLAAAQIAASPRCIGLMWGAEDLVAAMGGSNSRFTASENGHDQTQAYRDVPRHARAVVALAAAAYGKWAVDAVHVDITDTVGLTTEAMDAAALGFAATACIHPSQVPVIRNAYAPETDQLHWASRILEAAAHHQGVFQFEGQMVDAPLLDQARAIVARSH
jgi:citrate lyase subunit beta/citryl-CoA lyase